MTHSRALFGKTSLLPTKTGGPKGSPAGSFSQEGLFQLLRPEEDGAVVILEGVGLELVGRIGNESPEARKWLIFKRN